MRLYVCGGRGGQGLAKYNGFGGRGGNVYAVAKDGVTLKNICQQFPERRFSAANGTDSRYVDYVYLLTTFGMIYCDLLNVMTSPFVWPCC